MTTDDKIRDEKLQYNMILTEKLQKCHHCNLEKIINMNIFFFFFLSK